jgi:hypothetical protein
MVNYLFIIKHYILFFSPLSLFRFNVNLFWGVVDDDDEVVVWWGRRKAIKCKMYDTIVLLHLLPFPHSLSHIY